MVESRAATEEVANEHVGQHGPLGQPRGIGFGILLYIVTLNFYSWYWVYKTQEEMKQHTGDGLGGVLGLVVWILVSSISAFVIPSEVGKMYKKDGQQPPMTGWTGLWLVPGAILIIPAIVWFVKIQGALNRYWEGKAAAAPGGTGGTGCTGGACELIQAIFTASSCGSGKRGSSRRRVATRTVATARFRTQARSAGTTCHGASSIDVSVSVSS